MEIQQNNTLADNSQETKKTWIKPELIVIDNGTIEGGPSVLSSEDLQFRAS